MQTNDLVATNLAPQNVPRKQSRVVYCASVSVNVNRHDAMLEWGADNRIRLYALNESGQLATVLLDCAPQEIKRFSTAMGYGYITMHDRRVFRLGFGDFRAQTSTAAFVGNVGGVVGSTLATDISKAAAEAEEATDINWWRESLAQYGISGLQTPMRLLYNLDKATMLVDRINVGIFLAALVVFIIILLFPR